jgi:hypothetical protein
VCAEKGIRNLEIVKNDLFDQFPLLFFQILTFAPFAPVCTMQIPRK